MRGPRGKGAGPEAKPETTRRPRPDAGTVAAWVAIAAFVMVALGPSLLGLRTFVGIDLIQLSPPYARAAPLDQTVQNIFVRDNVDGLMPAYSEFRQRLTDGDIASWAPGRSGGGPLSAVPSLGLFSPLSLPYWALPTWLAVGYTQLLTIAVAIGGMALFLRRLRCGWAAALLGGLAFVSSGYMIAWVNWPQTRVGAFIPVLFWALERFLQMRTARSAVPIAVAVAGLLLGGFPAVAGLTLYAAAGYVLVRLLADGRLHGLATSVRHGLLAAAGVLVGVGLTAVQLLPFAAYVTGLDLSYRDEGFFSTTPLKYAVTAVFPQAWFANVAGPGSPFSRDLNPVEIHTYVGTVALLLVALAVLRRAPVERPRGARWFLVGVCAVTVWLVFLQGPLSGVIAHLPIFDGNPIGRIRSVLGFAAAALAGLGFDAVSRQLQVRRERAEQPRRDRRIWLERAALVVGLAGLLAGGYVVDRVQVPDFGSQVRTDVVIACAAAALAVVLILAADRWRAAALAAVVVLPLLVAGQALLAVQNFWPTGDPDEFYPVTATHEFLIENAAGSRVAPVADVLIPSSTDAYGLASIGGHSFLAPTWLQVLQNIDPNTLATPTIAALDARRPGYASLPGLDRLAARYYVSADFLPVPGTQVQVNRATGSQTVAPGTDLTTTIEPTALRGIGIPVTSARAPFTAQSRFAVTITDAAGDVVVSGERPVLRPRATLPRLGLPAVLFLPLAAEDAADRPGPWTVVVRFEGGPEVEVGTRDGGAELVVVEPAEDGLRLVQVADGVAVYERLTALPRIRWASSTLVIDDAQERAGFVAGNRYADDTVVLGAPGEPVDGAPATVEVVEDSGDTIRVQVDAEGAGYVVVADSIQSGWSAQVDGESVELVDAEHAAVAVHVPPGRHDIVVRYTPDGRTLGSWLSGASVLALMLLAFPPAWRRQARRRALG